MNHLSSQIIQWGLWTVIMTTFFYLIARSRKKDLNTNNKNELSLPLYVLIVGLVDFILFLGIAFVSNIYSNGTETAGTTVLFLGFSLLGLFLIYAYFIEKYPYNSKEIFYTKITGKKINIEWSTVNSVKYQASLQWIAIKYNNNKKCYFSTMLKGMKPFSEMILRNVENEKIDPKTLIILNRIINEEVI